MDERTSRYPRTWVAPAIIVLWALALMLVLAACGGDDSPSVNVEAPEDGDWLTATDQLTGRSFRCILWVQREYVTSGAGIGLSSFCYEPYVGAGE